MAKRFTVTTALPYANGPLHLGHVAGVYIPADIYVKYLKAKGEDVVFIGGTDEHGVPISIKAKNEGVTPKEVVDRYHNIIKDSLKGLGVSLDYFGQTSSKGHYETSSEWFKKLSDDGVFREEVSQQYYDEENNQFLADRYITGDCPECKKEGAYGDQCEKCGATLNATDLINPKSALSGNKPVLKDTKHWFLPLDKFEPWLKEWIEEMKPVLKANVYGQVKSWLDSGLHQRAITRDLDWGVPVPVEGGEGKVLYVWFDAPIGYVSFTKQLLENDPNRNWEDYWKKDGDSQLVHFLGKDNIVFHSVIFPSMLKSMGDYILPQNVPANEFLNLEGEKFSTSKNWAVWLDDFLVDFPDKTDVLRYVLCSIAPENKDSDFSWKDFQARNNNELCSIFGNFINRALVLTQKYYAGVVPALGELIEIDQEVLLNLEEIHLQIEKDIRAFKFRDGLSNAMKLARVGNKYLAETEPWKLAKEEGQLKSNSSLHEICSVCLKSFRSLSIFLTPIIPNLCEKIAAFYGEEFFNSFNLIEDDVIKIKSYKHLLKRIEQDSIDSMVSSNRAGE